MYKRFHFKIFNLNSYSNNVYKSKTIFRREQWPLFSSYACWQQLVNETKSLSRDHAALSEVYSTHLVGRLNQVMEDVQRIYKRVSMSQSLPTDLSFASPTQNTLRTFIPNCRSCLSFKKISYIVLSLLQCIKRFNKAISTTESKLKTMKLLSHICNRNYGVIEIQAEIVGRAK